MQNFRKQAMPGPVALFVELAKPDVVTVVWWEQLSRRGDYYKVRTTKHDWLVKQEGGDLKCWRLREE